MTLKAGIHEIDAAAYHADPCPRPSLSRTVAHLICSRSPLHAWTAHPRLNKNYQSTESEAFDIGTCAHALLLEGEAGVVIIEADDWRTKDAKDARDQARFAGLQPLLAKQWNAVQAMVDSAREQVAGLEVMPSPFADGKHEQTLVWEDSYGVYCRARIDWLRDDYSCIDDYKTTSRTANPEAWSRSLFSMGYDVQAAFYRRGLARLTGHVAEFRFVIQETYPPYALSVVSLTPHALDLAIAKVDYAVRQWSECLNGKRWPGYPSRVCFAEVPSFEETRWLDKEEREAA